MVGSSFCERDHEVTTTGVKFKNNLEEASHFQLYLEKAKISPYF